LGKGSTFTLYLPRVAGDTRSQQSAVEDATPIDGKGMSVLVVEDNAEVGRFTTDALAELGYGTTLVINATHALEELAAGAERYDVVFTDVVMPGMSGIELAREIRRHYADLPVVLTSGHSHGLSDSGSDGLELLQKPYSIDELSRVLHRVVRWRRAKRATRTATPS
jgi:two-component system NtrC family sensor kinase